MTAILKPKIYIGPTYTYPRLILWSQCFHIFFVPLINKPTQFWFLILDNHVKNKKYGNFVSISSLTGKCAAQKLKNFCSSSLLTCLHHMVILRNQNKITDFLMILAWASPFNRLFLQLQANTNNWPHVFLVLDCWCTVWDAGPALKLLCVAAPCFGVVSVLAHRRRRFIW